MGHPLLGDTPSARHLLLGNEAIVRGALEAGVEFVSCYPGTPSSEVPDTFFRLSPDGSYYFEYSVNEKVALEVGGGAAIGGLLTLVTMKHVGVNVAADPLMTLNYTGAPGGLTLLAADDPGCHSSQNEQDSRYYARLAGMTCLEPSTAQEAKDMTRDALKLARRTEQPVMLRTTTRVNHMRGAVEFGPLEKPEGDRTYAKAPMRYVPVPAVARIRHAELLKQIEIMRQEAEKSPWNIVSGSGTVGVVASGICRAYLKDVLESQSWTGKVKVLELGVTNPLPENLITDFLQGLDKVLVLEELEPILEKEIRSLAAVRSLNVTVLGKTSGDAALASYLPLNGEYTTGTVRSALGHVLDGKAPEAAPGCEAPEGLPMRPPNLCAGCSHRALYYAVRKTFGDNALYSMDIGCYTLGILPPLSTADFLLCMGSSVSAGCGMARADKRSVVAFIGDSTFFHSGLTGLVNAVFNKHNLLLVIMDNKTTAMTGHQPHPGVENTVLGENEGRVDVEAIVRGCGVEHVRRVTPYHLKKTLAALDELKDLSGVRVIIAEEPCVLFARRTLRKVKPQVAEVREQGPEVEECLETLACPAFFRDGSDVAIDPEQCSGCMVCLQITDKIKARKRQ